MFIFLSTICKHWFVYSWAFLTIFLGGHILILMNQRYFTDTPEYSHNLEPRMVELEQLGAWKRVLKKENIPKYHTNHYGVLFVLQKC